MSAKGSGLWARMGAIRSAPITIVAVACAALMIDNIAYSISFACLPHMFEDMELASESQIGIVTTMFGIGALVTSIFSGILSDRTGSRKLLLVVGAVGYSACGIMLHFAHKLWHILLYRFLNGLASGCVYPIAIATVGDNPI
ncbi:hypothetical protein GGI15_004471 [Coemansia interrupta]|uniref:Major facilitator superfamily (MFS) profile domain-containing protein n=1 Tax=Coemansia interrupta TaxID=1126814 RepID=A0A9W8H2J8_9FUNG|nr:hypothetical protein GGI15_004471 [Coemansia interrupta]